MANVDKAVIARLKIKDQTFEILVDCEKAIEFKEGKCALEDVLATRDIFKDVKQGERASEKEMQLLFGTEDKDKIAEKIIKTGEIQLTTEHKNRLREEKRKQIIEIIHKNAVDPKTGLPHPAKRIEMAMEEARVRIDEFKNPEEQVQDVLEKLRPLLPIKFELWEMEIKIPAQHAAQSYSILKNYGTLKKDEWQNDGGLLAVVVIPAGMSEKFENELNKLTKGELEINILNKQ